MGLLSDISRCRNRIVFLGVSDEFCDRAVCPHFDDIIADITSFLALHDGWKARRTSSEEGSSACFQLLLRIEAGKGHAFFMRLDHTLE